MLPIKSFGTYYFMENQHNIPQLVHDGYVFRRDRERPRHTLNARGENVTRIRSYWRCVIRSCRARGNVDPSGHLRLSHAHDHERNEESVKYRNLRTEIKKRCLEFKHETPREVLEHFKIRDTSLEKTIVNWRYRYIREPRSNELILQNLDMKDYLKKSDDGKLFSMKQEDVVIQEGEEVLLQEGDMDMYEVEEDVDEDGERRIFYILQE